jgi:DNA-binding MarR family transcriptional regulator
MPAPEYGLGKLLTVASNGLRARIQAALAEAGFADFHLSHQVVFQWLPSTGARIGELARSAGVTKQTMAEMVVYLELHGYVERSVDPTDRRAVLILRTPRGEAVDAMAQRAFAATVNDWRIHLGDKQFTELVRLLREVAALAEGDLRD